ncbi:MAG: hypothetical protein AB7F86_06105 [Bdellovibrionales bacterium]
MVGLLALFSTIAMANPCAEPKKVLADGIKKICITNIESTDGVTGLVKAGSNIAIIVSAGCYSSYPPSMKAVPKISSDLQM